METTGKRIHVGGPLLQPGARFLVVTMAVVNRGHRGIDVIEDPILYDSLAA